MIQSLAITLLLVGVAASVPPESDGVYELLAKGAADPALRRAVCSILVDDLHPDGEQLAMRYRSDADPTVRGFCFLWLIKMPSDQQNDWLLEGLRDPSPRVQAYAVLSSDEVAPWSTDVWASLWNVLQTSEGGHLFGLTAHALAQRGGAETAAAVFDVAEGRGAGWLPCALKALAAHPQEAFRDVFEAEASSDDWDQACLGRRGLAVLDEGGGGPEDGMTTAEFHAAWRAPSVSLEVPEVLAWDAFVVRLRRERVIILGELHAAVGGRAPQIAILADLVHAKDSDVVLIGERGVLEYQEPVLAAARQYGVEIRNLESEALALNESPSTRDRIARAALVEMVEAEPETTFVVCYGDNHRRSFQAALADVGVASASVTLSGAEGMLGSSMRATRGRIQGRCFAYSGGSYYLPAGSYATLLGAPGLDLLFLPD